MTTYVFFVGGTGARVLRSLVMLLASGVEIGANNKIVPIIIDYDMQNGDLKEAKDLLNLYNRLQNTAAYASGESGFFNAAIEMRDYSMANIKGDGDRDTFAKYIMYSFLKNDKELAPTAALINALYDDSPQDSPSTELNLEMSVGFKGNPNIGSVIFNDYFNDRSYGYQDFVSEHRIFRSAPARQEVPSGRRGRLRQQHSLAACSCRCLRRPSVFQCE